MYFLSGRIENTQCPFNSKSKYRSGTAPDYPSPEALAKGDGSPDFPGLLAKRCKNLFYFCLIARTSISTSQPSLTVFNISTSVLTGFAVAKYLFRTAETSANLLMFVT